jgi:aryl-alcohol dehydrogenase-like predicted oxidoreductase
MGLVGWYGTRNDAEARETLLDAIDRGVTHFDTAASYQLGENERFVGASLKPFRNQVYVASKCGLARGADGGAMVDNRPETIRRSLDESLARLGFEELDLFYLHRIDKTVPIEDSVGALADLVRTGKIKHIGLSECSSQTLRRAAAIHPIAAVQSEYSIWSRDPEGGLLATCKALGTGFVSYSPLGRGFLAGNFRSAADLPVGDQRQSHPRFQEGNAAHNEALVYLIEALAAEKSVTAAQVAIAWVLARDAHIVTIPGMKTRAHLADNLAADSLRLSDSDLKRIDALLAVSPIAGDRQPPAMMRVLDRD